MVTLEVGKKYRVNNPKYNDVKYVEVLSVDDYKDNCGRTVFAVARTLMGDVPVTYYSDGRYLEEGPAAWDIVGEYVEPISTHFYAVARNGILAMDALYLSKDAAINESHGWPVIKLKVEQVEEE